jgi:hypothetical protein
VLVNGSLVRPEDSNPSLLIRSKFPPSAVLTCVFAGRVRAYAGEADAAVTIILDLADGEADVTQGLKADLV